MRTRACWLILVLLLACHRGPSTEPRGSSRGDADEQVFVGLASYGDLIDKPLQTSEGNTVAPPLYTAAHRTLPLGTQLLVTNLQNNKSLAVTITHRGPERKEYILELNLAAAQELNMLSQTPVQVRMEVMHEK